jgi:hypothetical protein
MPVENKTNFSMTQVFTYVRSYNALNKQSKFETYDFYNIKQKINNGFSPK